MDEDGKPIMSFGYGDFDLELEPSLNIVIRTKRLNGEDVVVTLTDIDGLIRGLELLLEQRGVEIWNVVGDARVVAWFCPLSQERGCKTVEWTEADGTTTPRCCDCGEVGPSRRVHQ